MADLNDFDSTLHPWLQKVWECRKDILQGATAQKGSGVKLVYRYYNSDDTKTVKDKSLQVFLSKCRDLAKAYGFEFASQEGKELANTFYHFSRSPAREIRERIYVNPLPDGRSTRDEKQHKMYLLGLLLKFAQQHDGIVKLKVAGPGLKERTDTIVIYTASDIVRKFVLREMEKPGYRIHYSGATPPGAKQQVPGLAYAEQSPKVDTEHLVSKGSDGLREHSFGTYLASGIFLALRLSGDSHALTGDENFQKSLFLDNLLAVFREIGVNPKTPHQFDKPFDMRHFARVANHSMVRNHRQAGDLVLHDPLYHTDPTQPLFPVDESEQRKMARLRAAVVHGTGQG